MRRGSTKLSPGPEGGLRSPRHEGICSLFDGEHFRLPAYAADRPKGMAEPLSGLHCGWVNGKGRVQSTILNPIGQPAGQGKCYQDVVERPVQRQPGFVRTLLVGHGGHLRPVAFLSGS